ncbi:hypothetical protein [Dysgonomonas sp. Marseille-P4361]|uniref:hypothetical protein n=1 Tax=Dysgonomonas sp. Marseille-P4361 TaxID=2161820 RepID=UPI000D54D79A|nr:hypothetical protein [Dysgonomonas sp. Marseille-P4361]
MKNYKNKLLATLLAVFTLFSFTSCETDDWFRGDYGFSTSEFEVPPYTDNRGTFSLLVDLYDTDIRGYDARIDYLNDFDIYNSWLTIYSKKSFREGDQIDVYLESNGIGRYKATLRVDYRGEAYIDGGYDPNLRNFMYRFTDKLLANGRAQLHIYGELYDHRGYPINQSLPFDVTLENSLDLLIGGRR